MIFDIFDGSLEGGGTELFPVQITDAVQVGPAGLFADLTSGGSLTVGTTYFYVVTATTSDGESIGQEVAETPTTGNQTVVLQWQSTTNATGYNVYRGTSLGGENRLLASLSALTLFYYDTGSAGSVASPPIMNSANLGQWQYTWTEQTFDGGTGVYSDAVSAREGDKLIGPFLVEMNNNQATVPGYFWARLRGMVAGQPFYEFQTDSASSDLQFTTVTNVCLNGAIIKVEYTTFDLRTGVPINIWCVNNPTSCCASSGPSGSSTGPTGPSGSSSGGVSAPCQGVNLFPGGVPNATATYSNAGGDCASPIGCPGFDGTTEHNASGGVDNATFPGAPCEGAFTVSLFCSGSNYAVTATGLGGTATGTIVSFTASPLIVVADFSTSTGQFCNRTGQTGIASFRVTLTSP